MKSLQETASRRTMKAGELSRLMNGYIGTGLTKRSPGRFLGAETKDGALEVTYSGGRHTAWQENGMLVVAGANGEIIYGQPAEGAAVS